MTNPVLVEVAEGVERLLHDAGGLLLGEMLLLRDVVKQFSTFAQSILIVKKEACKNLLGDQETDSIGFPGFKQLDYVRVVERSEDADFVLESFIVTDPRFLHGLNRNFLTC